MRQLNNKYYLYSVIKEYIMKRIKQLEMAIKRISRELAYIEVAQNESHVYVNFAENDVMSFNKNEYSLNAILASFQVGYGK